MLDDGTWVAGPFLCGSAASHSHILLHTCTQNTHTLHKTQYRTPPVRWLGRTKIATLIVLTIVAGLPYWSMNVRFPWAAKLDSSQWCAVGWRTSICQLMGNLLFAAYYRYVLFMHIFVLCLPLPVVVWPSHRKHRYKRMQVPLQAGVQVPWGEKATKQELGWARWCQMAVRMSPRLWLHRGQPAWWCRLHLPRQLTEPAPKHSGWTRAPDRRAVHASS